MPTAKIAMPEMAYLKILAWGVPKVGKTEFALSAPRPLVLDYESSSTLYANDYDFMVARPIVGNSELSTKLGLTRQVLREIGEGQYPDRKTLVLDPVSDVLEDKEAEAAEEYERRIGKNLQELNALQRTKWYAFRRVEIRKALDRLFSIPMDLILIARAKEIWNGSSPSGRFRADVNPIVESLMDVILEFRRSEDHVFSVKSQGCRKLVIPIEFEAERYHGFDIIQRAKELAFQEGEHTSAPAPVKQKPPAAKKPDSKTIEPIQEKWNTLIEIIKKLVGINEEYGPILTEYAEYREKNSANEIWLDNEINKASKMLSLEENIPKKFDFEATQKAVLEAIGNDPDLQTNVTFIAEIRSTTRAGKIFATANEFDLLNEDGSLLPKKDKKKKTSKG